MSWFDLITENTTSNPKMNKLADIGTHWRVPHTNLKYFVIIAPLIMHGSWFFSSILICLAKFSQIQRFLAH